jgi:hypothetical protein
VEGPGEGYIVFRRPWPGMMRTVYGDHARFQATYFSRFPGYYMSGDGARRDADGYIWITGRIQADPDQKNSEFCLFVMIFSWELPVAVEYLTAAGAPTNKLYAEYPTIWGRLKNILKIKNYLINFTF